MESQRGLTDEEFKLFSDRVGRGLKERPLVVLPKEHREQVAELLRQLGEATYYHLLGIDPGSGAREVHEAYDRVARLVHPHNARRLGLEGREGVLQLLFERATLAYLTLSDTDRRKAYDREAGPARWTALRMAQTAQASKADEARRCLEQARSLAQGEDFHSAIELLRKAVLLAPTHESVSLLGLLLAKNPQWVDEAVEMLERAEEMGTADPAVPEALKELRETIKARPAETGKPGQTIPFRKPKRG
ncbi:MAG TPA: DnaJ domain-containing protein [Thermoanaerobaculia bacterium]|nr:DnaJ domain-containing protein [Thermoanaerobaculia bacterium]